MKPSVNRLPRVLLVGMADSIHLARWILQFEHSGLEFKLISSSPHRRLHPDIALMVAGKHPSGLRVSMPWVSRYLSLPFWLLDRFVSDYFRGTLVRYQIRNWNPDLVHALELQNAGYSAARAFDGLLDAEKPKFLITNYGSEIVWFRKFPRHLVKLQHLVSIADAFSAECNRDVVLAREIGFRGRVLQTIPVSGGIDASSEMEKAISVDFHQRTSIAVKGYQNVWGQALNALRAIEEIAPELGGITIELFSCNLKTVRAATQLARRTGLNVVAHKKHSLRHKDVLEIMRRSVAYVGLSKSDGISTSMIEAMSQGAIPIQSNSSCGSEWLVDGRDGFLVHYTDIRAVSMALKKIATDEDFVKSAQVRNFATIAERYDKNVVSEVARGYYSQLLA